MKYACEVLDKDLAEHGAFLQVEDDLVLLGGVVLPIRPQARVDEVFAPLSVRLVVARAGDRAKVEPSPLHDGAVEPIDLVLCHPLTPRVCGGRHRNANLVPAFDRKADPRGRIGNPHGRRTGHQREKDPPCDGIRGTA